jgi:DNA-binding response OmpR family regulator
VTKILIADDDQLTTVLLQTLFEMEGIRAVCVNDSRSVLSSIEAERPALVLLDYYLGGIESTALVRQIRDTPAIHDVPIVILSGADRAAETLDAGADRFLGKPFEPDKLLAIINDLISHGSAPADS